MLERQKQTHSFLRRLFPGGLDMSWWFRQSSPDCFFCIMILSLMQQRAAHGMPSFSSLSFHVQVDLLVDLKAPVLCQGHHNVTRNDYIIRIAVPKWLGEGSWISTIHPYLFMYTWLNAYCKLYNMIQYNFNGSIVVYHRYHSRSTLLFPST